MGWPNAGIMLALYIEPKACALADNLNVDREYGHLFKVEQEFFSAI
jgi:hypothetical protein